MINVGNRLYFVLLYIKTLPSAEVMHLLFMVKPIFRTQTHGLTPTGKTESYVIYMWCTFSGMMISGDPDIIVSTGFHIISSGAEQTHLYIHSNLESAVSIVISSFVCGNLVNDTRDIIKTISVINIGLCLEIRQNTIYLYRANCMIHCFKG